MKNPGIFEIPLGSNFNDLSKSIIYYNDSDIDTYSGLEILKNNQIIVIKKQNDERLISINKANIYELSSLPGIGKSTAAKIIDYRKTYGSFIRIDDLLNISGIGVKKLEAIKPYICI